MVRYRPLVIRFPDLLFAKDLQVNLFALRFHDPGNNSSNCFHTCERKGVPTYLFKAFGRHDIYGSVCEIIGNCKRKPIHDSIPSLPPTPLNLFIAEAISRSTFTRSRRKSYSLRQGSPTPQRGTELLPINTLVIDCIKNSTKGFARRIVPSGGIYGATGVARTSGPSLKKGTRGPSALERNAVDGGSRRGARMPAWRS